jgi:hypothetical protein
LTLPEIDKSPLSPIVKAANFSWFSGLKRVQGVLLPSSLVVKTLLTLASKASCKSSTFPIEIVSRLNWPASETLKLEVTLLI